MSDPLVLQKGDGIYGAMDTTSRVGVSFGAWLPESFYEDFASILEACEIEEEEATGNDVRMEVATDTTSEMPQPYTHRF